MPLQDDIRYRILKLLESDPSLLAGALGLSLGKTNFCVRALVYKGLIKVNNFRNKHNKLAYAYLLTPTGIADKVNVTRRFLQHKIAEYDALEAAIGQLRREVNAEPHCDTTDALRPSVADRVCRAAAIDGVSHGTGEKNGRD